MEKNKDLYNELETSLAYGYEMTIRNIPTIHLQIFKGSVYSALYR